MSANTHDEETGAGERVHEFLHPRGQTRCFRWSMRGAAGN
jgi:hypothetical protein